MMHDFAITEDYALFHIVPSIGSWERLEQGKPHFGFDTTLPVYLGRDPATRRPRRREDIRWFKRGNCFASHVLNALQEGTTIHFDTAEAEEQHVPVLPRRARRAVQRMEAMSYLTAGAWT